MSATIHEGDALAILRTLPSDQYHGSLTDPPYGLSFMGHAWDHGVPSVEVWAEVLRCLRPGAHLLAFGGTRTLHRLACAIEDAGFEIRDCTQWLYATGYPKSHDVSKAIDKANGDWRGKAGAVTTGQCRHGRTQLRTDTEGRAHCTSSAMVGPRYRAQAGMGTHHRRAEASRRHCRGERAAVGVWRARTCRTATCIRKAGDEVEKRRTTDRTDLTD